MKTQQIQRGQSARDSKEEEEEEEITVRMGDKMQSPGEETKRRDICR